LLRLDPRDAKRHEQDRQVITFHRVKSEKMKRSGEKANRRSNSCAIDKRLENCFRFEYLSCDGTSGAGMFLVIAVNLFHGIDNFIQRSKREETAGGAVILGESGFLNEIGRASCRDRV